MVNRNYLNNYLVLYFVLIRHSDRKINHVSHMLLYMNRISSYYLKKKKEQIILEREREREKIENKNK